MKLIDIQNLTYKYDNNHSPVLNNLDFSVKKQEIIGILGRTGSGKSTLIKHLNGILKSNNGKVKILERELNEKSRKLKDLRKNVGVVFQFPEEQLFAENSKEDILFGPNNFDIPKEEQEKQIEFLSEKLGLTKSILESPSEKLSGGEKRRVALASVLSSNPQILVLDEPTIGLDYENKVKLISFLKELNNNGTTIIIVSHDLNTMWEILSRVMILEEGKKIFDGTRGELIKKRKKLEDKGIYFPDYIIKLEELGLLEGNEDKITSKESALNIVLRGEKNE